MPEIVDSWLDELEGVTDPEVIADWLTRHEVEPQQLLDLLSGPYGRYHRAVFQAARVLERREQEVKAIAKLREVDAATKPLSKGELAFCADWLKHGNATVAYLDNIARPGTARSTAGNAGAVVLKRPHVRRYLAEARREAMANDAHTAAHMIEELADGYRWIIARCREKWVSADGSANAGALAAMRSALDSLAKLYLHDNSMSALLDRLMRLTTLKEKGFDPHDKITGVLMDRILIGHRMNTTNNDEIAHNDH